MGPRGFLALLVGLLSVCGLVVGPASGSCAFVIDWNGVRYESADLDVAPRFGPALDDGEVPACDDTASEGGCDRVQGGEDEAIAVHRIPGIDPHVALAAALPGGEHQAFVASGFFTSLPSHPLHGAIYGSPRRPDARSAPWHCGNPIPGLMGTVSTAPGFGVFGVRFDGDRVRREAGATRVAVDAKTTVRGFDEYGLPRVRPGDTLHAVVRECAGPGGRYQVVADAIER